MPESRFGDVGEPEVERRQLREPARGIRQGILRGELRLVAVAEQVSRVATCRIARNLKPSAH